MHFLFLLKTVQVNIHISMKLKIPSVNSHIRFNESMKSCYGKYEVNDSSHYELRIGINDEGCVGLLTYEPSEAV